MTATNGKPAGSARDISLDALRGLDVLLMILVNLQGSDTAAFPLLVHARWNGLTFADLVFPVFLLVTGISVSMAIDGRGRTIGVVGIIRRSMLLCLIGVVLGWLIHPSFAIDQIRLAGVLQRIGIVYLICAVLARSVGGALIPLALAAALLGFDSWVLLRVAAPGQLHATIAEGAGISAWLDQHFLPGKLHRTTWDPEGVLSTLPAIASGLIGLGLTRCLRMAGLKNWAMLAAGFGLVLAGYLFTPVLPFNKNLWTASFTLTTAGVGFATWAVLRTAVQAGFASTVLSWLAGIGRGALTIYVVHMLLIALLVRKFASNQELWSAGYALLAQTGMPPHVAALLFAVIATVVSIVIFARLAARGFVLKV